MLHNTNREYTTVFPCLTSRSLPKTSKDHIILVYNRINFFFILSSFFYLGYKGSMSRLKFFASPNTSQNNGLSNGKSRDFFLLFVQVGFHGFKNNSVIASSIEYGRTDLLVKVPKSNKTFLYFCWIFGIVDDFSKWSKPKVMQNFEKSPNISTIWQQMKKNLVQLAWIQIFGLFHLPHVNKLSLYFILCFKIYTLWYKQLAIAQCTAVG